MEIPAGFEDQVFTFAIMRDPVQTPQGNSYEREHIAEWIRVNGTDPLTRGPLALADLRPNRSLRCVRRCPGWLPAWHMRCMLRAATPQASSPSLHPPQLIGV